MLKHECAVDTNGVINRYAAGREHKDTIQKHGEHKQRMGHILEIFSGQSQAAECTYVRTMNILLLSLCSSVTVSFFIDYDEHSSCRKPFLCIQ